MSELINLTILIVPNNLVILYDSYRQGFSFEAGDFWPA